MAAVSTPSQPLHATRPAAKSLRAGGVVATSLPVRSADFAAPERLPVEALNCGRSHLVLNLHQVSRINSESLGSMELPWDPCGAGQRRPGGPAGAPPSTPSRRRSEHRSAP
jgi:hypothetical protein